VVEPPSDVTVEAWYGNGTISKAERPFPLEDAVIWIDLGRGIRRDDIADYMDSLALPGYQRGMIAHVLSTVGPDDYGAEDVPYYDAAAADSLRQPAGPTFLELFGVSSDVPSGPYEPPLVYHHPIVLLVTTEWLISYRLPGRASDGVVSGTCDPVPFAELRDAVYRYWQRAQLGGEIATMILRVAASTYEPALRALDRRLQDLQQAFVRSLDEPGEAGTIDAERFRRGLLQVKWNLDGISRRIAELSRPSITSADAWFVVHSMDHARATQSLLERADVVLHHERGEVRDSLALIASTETGQQLALARAAQIEIEKATASQRRVELVVQLAAAIVVLPGLAAGIFGALPDLWRDCPTTRTIVVLSVVVGLAVASLAGLLLFRHYRTDRQNQNG
jgi:hypothetical protein